MFIIISTSYNLKNVSSAEVKIIMKINNEIITNVDIENELIYLVSLNKSLKNIRKETVLDLAKKLFIKRENKKNRT